MHPDALACLRCPLCRGPFTASPRALRCPAGHAFDVAREGYVSFLTGRPTGLAGDDAAMVAARARFLAGGHLAPLADAIAARAAGAGPGVVIEVGAGTGHYLARALDASPERAGVALDLSRHAARRAARAHPRLGAVVADVTAALPLADGCAALVLDVFAPRNGAELRRVAREDGTVLVVTPAPEHLAELRAPLGLLDVDPEKERRLDAALGPHLERASTDELAWTMALGRDDVVALATMGPSARHLDPGRLAERAAALSRPFPVTASVRLAAWRPRRAPRPSAG